MDITAEGIDCLIVVGLATGTDCAGSAAAAGIRAAALTAKTLVVGGLQEVKSHLAYVKEVELPRHPSKKNYVICA